jgi:hypothetical protein
MSELNIDYNKVEDKLKTTVKAIEAKPHVRYIRYLLSKMYSPSLIKQELFKLGLSAPHEANLIGYYMAIVDPIIRKQGLSQLYSSYKNKLLKKNPERARYADEVLNYKVDLADDLDGQVKFCKFIKELEVDSLWIGEIYRFHGSVDKFPVDEEGNRILVTSAATKSYEKILINPKRYLVDKFILEGIPDSRIIQYCRDTLKLVIYEYDLELYRRVFFNLKTNTIEDKIKALEVERNSLIQTIKDIDGGDVYPDMGLGERSVIRSQSSQRIEELDGNIKTLNMLFSEFAFKAATSEHNDFEKMFSDIVNRGYKRFCELDAYKDRDVVDPMFKVARLMTFAHDKVENIAVAGGKNGSIADKHSQTVLMELYKQRTDEIMNEQLVRANKELSAAGIEPIEEKICAEDIAGIEDLGVSFEVTKEDDK